MHKQNKQLLTILMILTICYESSNAKEMKIKDAFEVHDAAISRLFKEVDRLKINNNKLARRISKLENQKVKVIVNKNANNASSKYDKEFKKFLEDHSKQNSN